MQPLRLGVRVWDPTALPTWPAYVSARELKALILIQQWCATRERRSYACTDGLRAAMEPLAVVRPTLTDKMVLWRGDLTTLPVDALLISATSDLVGA